MPEWRLDDDGEGREYLEHLIAPGFKCRVFTEEAQDEPPADTLSGLTYSSGDGILLCEFEWDDRDDSPPAANLNKLLAEAIEFIKAEGDDAGGFMAQLN